MGIRTSNIMDVSDNKEENSKTTTNDFPNTPKVISDSNANVGVGDDKLKVNFEENDKPPSKDTIITTTRIKEENMNNVDNKSELKNCSDDTNINTQKEIKNEK